MPHDLNKFPMILPTEQTQTYHAMQEYFLKHDIHPKIIGKCKSVRADSQEVIGGLDRGKT